MHKLELVIIGKDCSKNLLRGAKNKKTNPSQWRAQTSWGLEEWLKTIGNINEGKLNDGIHSSTT